MTQSVLRFTKQLLLSRYIWKRRVGNAGLKVPAFCENSHFFWVHFNLSVLCFKYSLQQQKMGLMIILEVEILHGTFLKGLISINVISHSNSSYIYIYLNCCGNMLCWPLLYLYSLLAKLDKADRALCFTSGMAALSAVAHLVGTGTFLFLFFYCFYLFILISFPLFYLFF